jgi:hypothetical protein
MGGFGMLQRRKGATPAKVTSARKVYSIPGLMRGRELAGSFEVGGTAHEYSFAPSAVAVVEGRIVLTGTFRVTGANRTPVSGVQATLASTQGGLGQAPIVLRELLAATAQGPKTTTGDVQEQTSPPAKPPESALPITEATDSTSFVGVMYLRLSPLDARALGVAADLTSVQLNARLAPTSEMERELQWLYSGLVMAAIGPSPDARSTEAHVNAINTLLRG